ncbi:hypothetical protein A1O7_04481 [Cladophialophora yegresii CBS 114405]|uniref:Uncharacterized protein n=1 Tax=Cladophialophora yegresii CBS 114405 TaxID=1182544 RepID=W9WPM2_9EURO|nr:uncharacterized protein A1O7_04481 [Cladophialophora yegresii CBS 114405]EXJ60329.1 hypothetical protein A1O7_04481 [Cladophialophora yegresii CBS 114405]
MNLQNGVAHLAQEPQLYTFGDEPWTQGVAHSFEVGLAASDGNEPSEVTRCIAAIRLVQSDQERLDNFRVHSPRLYHRLLHEEAAQLLPRPETGMTAGSLRFVIRFLNGTIDLQGNKERQSSKFLMWLAQICITLWKYDCNRQLFVDLEERVHEFVCNDIFQPSENDAAYLAIIAFVLGGRMNDKLHEYVDAVVWHSRADFASVISPLRRVIIRERQALLEVIFGRFCQILTSLAYSDDVRMRSLGETLHKGFQNATNPQMDFGKPYAHSRHIDCARYPEILQTRLFDALGSERTRLMDRAPSIASNHSDTSSKPIKQELTRLGGGIPAIKGLTRKVTGMNQESPPPSKRPAERITAIIAESEKIIGDRRERIEDAVKELIEDRDDRYDRGLGRPSAEEGQMEIQGLVQRKDLPHEL